MENIKDRLIEIRGNISSYFKPLKEIRSNAKQLNLVFDIEACGIKNKTEMLTYSIAVKIVGDKTDVCYWTNSVEEFLDVLLRLNNKEINLFAHNLLYDIKPFLLEFTSNEKYKAFKQDTKSLIKEQIYDRFENKKVTYFKAEAEPKRTKNTYDMIIKKGQLYKVMITTENSEINFVDTFKIVPYSLKKCSEAFLGYEMSKEGLDYDKERTLDEKLTEKELIYIYEDVYVLEKLVLLLKVEGIDVGHKKCVFTKLTNSAQSLADYKETLHEDYLKRQNAFACQEFYDEVDSRLQQSNYFSTKNEAKKCDKVFKAVYPPLNIIEDRWCRPAYFGGLTTPHYENIEKYKNVKDKHGIVLDVNSLFPFAMRTFLLPYGRGNFCKTPYVKCSESYKEMFPLYIQEIKIYDFEIKKNKMPFIQVKHNPDFPGVEPIKNNIRKDGKKVTLNMRLSNVMLDLLFENYDVKNYKLGSHMAFKGSYYLFENYLSFWAEVKKTSKGAKRELAKLRQNALYGKFGMSEDNDVVKFVNKDGLFTIENTDEKVTSEGVYLPMALFITSYAKEYLVHAINSNYDNFESGGCSFLYADTDSCHLLGKIEGVKGMKIDKKEYGAWDNELTFDDFKYIGPKRYAERNVKDGKWIIKCCGLSDEIMKKVDDISTFENCPYSAKELMTKQLYIKDTKDDVYYYEDKEHTIKVKGLYRSKKSRNVKNGTLILETPYKLSESYYKMFM